MSVRYRLGPPPEAPEACAKQMYPVLSNLGDTRRLDLLDESIVAPLLLCAQRLVAHGALQLQLFGHSLLGDAANARHKVLGHNNGWVIQAADLCQGVPMVVCSYEDIVTCESLRVNAARGMSV